MALEYDELKGEFVEKVSTSWTDISRSSRKSNSSGIQNFFESVWNVIVSIFSFIVVFIWEIVKFILGVIWAIIYGIGIFLWTLFCGLLELALRVVIFCAIIGIFFWLLSLIF